MDVFEYVGLGEHLDAQRGGMIPVEGKEDRLMVGKLQQTTTVGAWHQREHSWGPLRQWQFEAEMYVQF